MPPYHDARTSAAADTTPAQGSLGFACSTRGAVTGAGAASFTPRAALTQLLPRRRTDRCWQRKRKTTTSVVGATAQDALFVAVPSGSSRVVTGP